ncbi:PqqD family peptide modification chaperone [Streptomyces sp. x-80]|uniref:PqqD family peptide modification chaperone n=1 Tax=Streptomyces sp. x-80 TaxID=2789282 RepID=UPI00397FB227
MTRPADTTPPDTAPTDTSANERSWLDIESPAIRPDIEIVEGINHELVAFDPLTGHYTRLSASGAAILRALDGTVSGREFAARVARKSRPDSPVEQTVLAFLDELRAAGLLTVPPASGRQQAAVRFARRSHMPRRALPLRQITRLIDPVSRVLRRAPWLFAVLWAIAALLSLREVASVLATPRAADLLSVSGLTWGWCVLAGAVLVQTALHELSHAVVCRYYGVPVREIGVGLLFYVVPAAYVDRTDAYRLASRRARVLICLAGPMLDAVWLGCHAYLATHVDGPVGQAFGVLLWVQTAMLMANLNPLLPTDGYQALESGLGAINLRSRAFTALRCLLLRQPRPSWLAARSRAQRVRYHLFGVICLAYAALVVGLTFHALTALVG